MYCLNCNIEVYSSRKKYCSSCKQEKKNQWQRMYRIKTHNRQTKEYEKTINGFLMRAYRNMKSRVTGIQKQKAYLYKDKDLLLKENFYIWSKNNNDFYRLYKAWVLADYNQKLTPSVNRIDSNKGYLIENMEWITHSMNSGLSSVTKKSRNKEKQIIYNVLGVQYGT